MSDNLFTGEEGVYYNPSTNNLLILSNRKKTQLINRDTFALRDIFTYNIQWPDSHVTEIALSNAEKLVYLGGFE